MSSVPYGMSSRVYLPRLHRQSMLNVNPHPCHSLIGTRRNFVERVLWVNFLEGIGALTLVNFRAPLGKKENERISFL